MTPRETFCHYVALKLHFSRWDYDYDRYGLARASREAFEKRTDQDKFATLSRRRFPIWTMISVFSRCENKWIGDMLNEEAEEVRDESMGRIEALTRTLERDLSRLPDLREAVLVEGGRHPLLARETLGRRISMETAAIVVGVTGCVPHWRSLTDPAMESLTRRLAKYYPLMPIDRKKVKKLVLERYELV